MSKLQLSWLFLLCIAAVMAARAQSTFFTTLVSFDGPNGANPYAGLVEGQDGNFYGTTGAGGNSNSGTVFKITPAGTLTMLYSFCSQPNCADGGDPSAVLRQGTDGNFYGTTVGGGADGRDWGTVFRLTPSGGLTTLYSFCAQGGCADGGLPLAGLVQGHDGSFYGTTSTGGVYGGGTVFKITTDGTLTTLHNFCAETECFDGAQPVAGLIQASDGVFYGTTWFGGFSGNCNQGCGTVFKITNDGTLTTLYRFCKQSNCPDGVNPASALVQAADGNLYGTTYYGGAYFRGEIFRITTSGKLITLYSFCSQPHCADGAYLSAGLVQANDRSLYGMTYAGGTEGCSGIGCGTVFEITLAGTLTTLHTFDNTDGSWPSGGLVQASNRSFYGTTGAGGPGGDGTVFRIGTVRRCTRCGP